MNDDSPQSQIDTMTDSSQKVTTGRNEEPDFQPFNRTPKYPHEVKIYFGVLLGLLIAVHLEYIAVWWLFAWSIGVMLPGELNKLYTYGFGAYVSKLHFKWFSIRDIGIIIGGFLMIFCVLVLLVLAFIGIESILIDKASVAIQSASETESGHLLSTAIINWWIYGLAVIAMFLIIGPAEELLFRHQLQNGLKKRFTRWKAILITNVLFSLVHLPVIIFVPNLLLMILPLTGIFFLGTIFSIQYELTDNLFVPSFTHSMYNTLVLTALLFGFV